MTRFHSDAEERRTEGLALTDVVANDRVLTHFRGAVDTLYGDRAERVVLFGSRARGDNREDSDYDIAVFLKNMGNLWDELGLLADITTDILYETGAVISAKPFPAEAYRDRTILMAEIRRDGLDL